MKYFLSLLIWFFFFSAVAQASKDQKEILIDPEYKGTIEVFAKPAGRLVGKPKQDFKNEDFLYFTVLAQKQDYFFGKLTYSISGKQFKGWLKKANYIGIYCRNYAPGDTLKLFNAPSSNSPVKNTIPEWINNLYQVVACNKDWLYVKVNYKGHIKEGWLAPDMQCANPYTTCN